MKNSTKILYSLGILFSLGLAITITCGHLLNTRSIEYRTTGIYVLLVLSAGLSIGSWSVALLFALNDINVARRLKRGAIAVFFLTMILIYLVVCAFIFAPKIL